MALRLKAVQSAAKRLPSQIMLALLIVALVGFLGLFLWQSLQIQKMQSEHQRKQAELVAVQERNDKLQEHLDFYKGPGYLLYVEKVAREALSLVKPGETVVLPQIEGASTNLNRVGANPVLKDRASLATGTKKKSNWQNWLHFFTGP